MTEDDELKEENLKELDNICYECKKEDESVTQNLILSGFKICNCSNLDVSSPEIIFLMNFLLICQASGKHVLRHYQKYGDIDLCGFSCELCPNFREKKTKS